jgi:hypothetical protein
MADAILAAFVLGPLLLTFLLKSNAALSFLALCAGFVVISFAGSDLQNLTGQLNFSIDSSIVNLVLLILPFVLTLLITRKSFSKKGGLVLHGLIALCAGALLALIGIPLLSESVRANFANSDLWTNLQKIQASIVGAGVFLSLVVLWAKSLKKPSVKDRKHKK